MGSEETLNSYLQDVLGTAAKMEKEMRRYDSRRDDFAGVINQLRTSPDDGSAKEELETLLTREAGMYKKIQKSVQSTRRAMKKAEKKLDDAEESVYRPIWSMLSDLYSIYKKVPREAKSIKNWYADKANEVARMETVDHDFLLKLVNKIQEHHERMEEPYSSMRSRLDGSWEDLTQQLHSQQQGKDSKVHAETVAAMQSTIGVQNFTDVGRRMVEKGGDTGEFLQHLEVASEAAGTGNAEFFASVLTAALIVLLLKCVTKMENATIDLDNEW